MENPSNLTKVQLKNEFKQTFSKYAANNANRVTREQAVKIIIECFEKCGRTCSPEKPIRFLKMFDFDDANQNKKVEVKKSLFATADLIKLDEKKAASMKKKWANNQKGPNKKGKGQKNKDKKGGGEC